MSFLAIASAALALSGSSTTGQNAPALQRLDGAPVSALAASGPTILMFWRADCGPCLLELGDLRALRSAAPNARVMPVGLQPPATLRPALTRLGLGDQDTLQAVEDPAALLTRLGGAPPRLPLTVAFRTDGAVCGRRSGLLGTDQVHAWSLTCGGARAGR